MWVKLFKTLGIYDEDYHKKYREYLHSKRYKTYIELVAGDIQEKILNTNKKQIDKLFKNFIDWKYIFEK
jgi:hypothetical protein